MKGRGLLLSAAAPVVNCVAEWRGRPRSCRVSERERIGGGRIVKLSEGFRNQDILLNVPVVRVEGNADSGTPTSAFLLIPMHSKGS